MTPAENINELLRLAKEQRRLSPLDLLEILESLNKRIDELATENDKLRLEIRKLKDDNRLKFPQV